MTSAVWTALIQAFAPLHVDWSPTAVDGPNRARFEVSGPGWTYHHAIYLTRKGHLLLTLEQSVPLDDPACFEKVASEIKANLNAM